MDLALLFLGLVWAFAGGGGRSGARPVAPSSPSSPSSPPQLPSPGWPGAAASTPPPWPQVVPTDLPKFPQGWEFDEPPPKAVQQRAAQLVDQLWRRGAGATKTEQTAGRWITYQAQIVASGKKGVVAYRLKRAKLPAAPAPAPAAPPATASVPPGAVPVSAPPAAAQWPPGSPEDNLGVRPVPSNPLGTRPAAVLKTLRYGDGLRPAEPMLDVETLQRRLGLPVDGRFGVGTQGAVLAFQRANGLKPDGLVGPKTWAKLFAAREKA